MRLSVHGLGAGGPSIAGSSLCSVTALSFGGAASCFMNSISSLPHIVSIWHALIQDSDPSFGASSFGHAASSTTADGELVDGELLSESELAVSCGTCSLPLLTAAAASFSALLGSKKLVICMVGDSLAVSDKNASYPEAPSASIAAVMMFDFFFADAIADLCSEDYSTTKLL